VPGETFEPDLSNEVAERTTGLRTGWTTGACSSAAAKAAVVGLTTGEIPDRVDIGLPNGTRVEFSVLDAGPCTPPGDTATAVVVKDAGDDPDCTDGAHLTVTVAWAPDGTTASSIVAGAGVGTITKPGLGLPVGAPAVNPVPRKMLLAATAEVTERPVIITIEVPGGEEMAKRTSNERLGIIGGISILGTTGIVRPFSTASYRASVVQQIDVAAAQHESTMVLCTGSRSEPAAIRLHPGLDPVCFVEVGDFSGIALRRCATKGMTRVDVVAMAGKITKLAAGVMMTHFHRSAVDTNLLAEVATETGAPARVIAAATETATARHFFEACQAAGVTAPLDRLCELARGNCIAHAGGGIECSVIMVDFDGGLVVARA
jgi:cobalt-precorrin-5B (C1)-methyltransferase